MKTLKLIFSKIFVFAILFLLQLTIMGFAIVMFFQYFVIFQLLSMVIALVVFFTIITKKESPEFKLPWLVFILVFPLFGLLAYVLFANPKMKKKEAKRIKEIHEKVKPYNHLTKEAQLNLQRQLGDFAGVENYLKNSSFQHGHLNNKVTYFKSGEDFFADLIIELKKAEKFIFMEYFIIDHGVMWNTIHEILKQKVKSGVEVRVIYDDIGTVGKLSNGYYKVLRQEGINCYKFNSFLPVISGIYNNRDHRKITVIDGKVGYTGGINLGDEYINQINKLGYWKDTSIKIEGSAVGNLSTLFLQTFDMTAKTVSDYQKYLAINYPKFEDQGYIHPFGDGPKPYYQEQIGENNYINLINRAKNYVYISTPYLILDYHLTASLRNASQRGVDVKIIVPSIPDKKLVFNMTRSNYQYLLQAGVKIYEYTPGFIHAKGLVADDECAFVGTINLDYRSLVHHYECGATMYKTPCIKDIKKDFDMIISQSKQIDENFHMNGASRMVNALLTIFAPML